jgi:hypothetical protein
MQSGTAQLALPLDLYVHTSDPINAVFSRVLPLMKGFAPPRSNKRTREPKLLSA